jgi:CDP-alcohol phosphatidyltransferase
MISGRNRVCSGILIFVDESAEWCCAGLRLIDRLLLAFNEFISAADGINVMPVCISRLETTPRSLPENSRLPYLSITDDIDQFSRKMEHSARPDCDPASWVLVVSTHLVICRGIAQPSRKGLFVDEEAPVLRISPGDLDDSRTELSERLAGAERARTRTKNSIPDWFYVESRQDIPECEKHLLRSTGKSQDGLIARFLNRPISRNLSRFLLRLPLSPNRLTLFLTAIPIAGAICLIQGHYFGFALGAVLFQLHSTLDGCDGEIARLKYLESDSGRKLDEICDRFASLLYAVSLGLGLGRQPEVTGMWNWIYPVEGAVAAVLIGVSETFLSRAPLEAVSGKSDVSRYLNEYRERFNRGDQLKLWVIRNSRMLAVGERATWLFSELTKRDVFNFIFMIIIVCGRPSWVLHILALCACAIMILAFKSVFAKPLPAEHASSP